MSELDETVKEFLVESLENLEQLDRELLALESDPTNLETINTIFRIVHTVKGTCGFFDFKKLEKVSHVGENLLDSLRSERLFVTEDTITGLLRLGDTLKEILSNIEQDGSEGDGDYSSLTEMLNELNGSATPTPCNKVTEPLPVLNHQEVIRAKNTTVEEFEKDPISHKTISNANDYYQDPHEDYREDFQEDLHDDLHEPEVDLDSMFAAAQAERDAQLVEECRTVESAPPESQFAEKSSETSSPLLQGKPATTLPRNNNQEQKRSELADTSLRVDVGILDKLMNLVGELVLARNQILQFTKKQNDGEFASTTQRLNLITSELQDGVMRTRMQPISTVWNKLPRVVRDMSHSCGKQVSLEIQGKETELDKTIIEAIKDPLTHIIRNSVDHGIETPECRTKAGKPSVGTLLMRAFHEGGQVIIEISDDGAGLNIERIRSKAVEKGLITADKASQMSEAEIHRLIFLPGFSTAEKVTNISGRGVGMDVVRSNIERIGGVVDVVSQFGKGSKFTIKIPLTLAIIPGLIVTTKGNRYAIPQVNLLELVRIEGEQIAKSIERIQGSDFYRLRGKILPLIYLDEQLALSRADSLTSSKNANIISLVVVRGDNHQFGLVVDAIHDTEEIVVKPLGRLLKGISSFAGATIMGDGQVALILDIVGIARKAQIAKKEGSIRALERVTGEVTKVQERKKMFVFEVGRTKRAAVPLENVYRLEEFPVEKLEQAGDHLVVQYRDGILPLVDLRSIFGNPANEHEQNVRAFVYCSGDQFVGFVVERIIDIVEQVVKVETPYRKAGLIGSGVIQGKVTDLLDLQAILQSVQLGPDNYSEEYSVERRVL